jgi:hypothetical protein
MRRKLKGIVAIAAMLLVPACMTTAALAAGQLKGGSYKGALLPATRAISVSFRVSQSGKQVTALSISNIPIYCSGGGPAIPIHFKNASISSKGTFASSARYVIEVGPLKGQVGEQMKITGKFLKGKREQGTLTTTYPKAAACGGKSPYTTTA